MDKIIIARHKEWKTEVTASSLEAAAKQLGADVKDMEIVKEYTKEEYLLRDIPEEFKGALSYMAYERGHSAGKEEVLCILQGLVADLKDSIQAFEKRIRAEAKQ